MPIRLSPCAAAAGLLAATILLAAGCAGPARKYDRAAHAAGFTQTLYQGPRFHHKIFRNSAPLKDGRLHVFIEGDVSVREALRHAPPDPTPRKGLMLQLMERDEAAAILLGRPCYHGVYEMDACEIRHLGRERYSREITDSMTGALRAEMQASGAREVVIFGYSGGGSLGLLMAGQIPETKALVTLAANLDNAALTAYQVSPPLSGSLDPANAPPLPDSVAQLHFFGERDVRLPVSLARETLARQKAAAVIVPGIDHDCCWQAIWPEIAARLQKALEGGAVQ